jgi:hypothetical protein
MYEKAGRTVEAPHANSTIIRGNGFLRSRKVVLLAGALFAIGSVLGVATEGAATAVAKAGGNTGNGAISAVTVKPDAKLGVYTVRFTDPTHFDLHDPEGFVLEEAVAVGTAVANDLGFTVTAGGTAFVVGDGFDITVADGTGKAKLATAAAVDGTQHPSLVLPYAVDATDGDVEAIVYEAGDFIEENLVFGAGITADSAREALRIRNITYG